MNKTAMVRIFLTIIHLIVSGYVVKEFVLIVHKLPCTSAPHRNDLYQGSNTDRTYNILRFINVVQS